jgi:hypothetical protein
MHFDNFAWIGEEISCDSLQISWGQCPRVPGKNNTLGEVNESIMLTILMKI